MENVEPVAEQNPSTNRSPSAMGNRYQPYGTASRTPPNCARCRNHDIILPLRGHKRYCQYIDCTCELCQLTVDRQKVMARQTAIRRAEEQDRQRVKAGLSVPGLKDIPRAKSPPSEPETSCLSAPDTSTHKPPPPSIITALSPDTSRRNSTASAPSGKDMWDSILLLLNWCGLPVNTTPLLHIILTEVTADAKEVYTRYRQAQADLRATCPIKEDPQPLDAHPWYYTSPPLLHPTAVYSSSRHLHPTNSLSSFRYSPYHPYNLIHHPYKSSMWRGLEPLRRPALHEFQNLSRPSVLVGTDYNGYDHQDLKTTSPSSVHSDKSSYSDSIDI